MAARTYLFTITHWLLRAGTVLFGCVAGLLLLAFGALCVAAVNLDGAHMHIPAVMDGITRATVLGLAIPAIGVLTACVAMLAWVLHLTARIVATAISGDPFVSQNTNRLMQIGWLLLTMQVVGMVMVGAISSLPQKFQDNIHFGFDTSPIGLMGILLVFVLAQVFRRGSEMRAELEATV